MISSQKNKRFKLLILMAISPLFLMMPTCESDECSESRVYKILSVSDLNNMRNDLNRSYKLEADLDLSGIENFEPIGTKEKPFQAGFDGGGKTIKGLTINRPGEDHVGLFGYSTVDSYEKCDGTMEEYSIKDLKLVDVKVRGKNYVGALIGYGHFNVTNVEVSGSVAGKKTVGGVVGYSQKSMDIKNAQFKGSVKGEDTVGGLVGLVHEGSRIEGSSTSGLDLRGLGNGIIRSIGGLVGTNAGVIADSKSGGKVVSKKLVGGGGLVGLNVGKIEKSDANVMVEGKSGIGGLVGLNYYEVLKSTAKGNVKGEHTVGGLIGYHGIKEIDDELGPKRKGKIEDSRALGSVTGGGDDVKLLVGKSVGEAKIDSKSKGSGRLIK